MAPRFLILCPVSVGLLFFTAGNLSAELVTISPFLPPQSQAAIAAPTATNPLELRGVTAMNGSTMFSIFDPVKKSGTWVKLNESGHDFAVKQYDADNDTVTVDYQGRGLTLAMRTPKIASSGTAVAPMPAAIPSPIANFRPSITTTNIMTNPTPAPQAAPLADWSAEIQRRREMRAQASGQTTSAPAAVSVRPQDQPNPQQNGAGGRMRQQRNGQ